MIKLVSHSPVPKDAQRRSAFYLLIYLICINEPTVKVSEMTAVYVDDITAWGTETAVVQSVMDPVHRWFRD